MSRSQQADHSQPDARRPPLALVTGGARRIGRAIVEALHARGLDVLIHCNQSLDEGRQLAASLNAQRSDSASVVAGELAEAVTLKRLSEQVDAHPGALGVVVNNASSFFPTPLGTIDRANTEALLQPNLLAPIMLLQALSPALVRCGGSVVNITDLYASKPLADHVVYSAAKAGLAMVTRSLAVDLAPAVRVNAVAPGAILWPESEQASDDEATATREKIIARTALGRMGTTADIAAAVCWLALDAGYVTGQVLAVDGGR